MIGHLPHIAHLPQAFRSGGTGLGDYATQLARSASFLWYKMGDASGTTLADASGNGRTATTTGTPTLGADGPVKNDPTTSILWDGSTQYGAFDSTIGQGNELLTGYTVGAWVRPRSQAASQCVIAYNDAHAQLRGTGATYDHRYVMASTASGNISGGTVVVGKWQFVVATYDGNNVSLYVDAVLVAGPSAVGALYGVLPHVAAGPLFPFAGGVTPWDGWVGSAFAHARPLSAGEILNLYNAGAKTMVSVTSVTAVATSSATFSFDAPFVTTPTLTLGDPTTFQVLTVAPSNLFAPAAASGPTTSLITPRYTVLPISTNAWRIILDNPKLKDAWGTDRYLRTPTSGTIA